MKTLVILAVFVALSAGGAIPVDTNDFADSEVQPVDLPEPEILEEPIDLVEDSLRDVEEPVNAEEAVAFDDPSRNGANNQYWLFTRQNPTNRQVLTHNNAASIRNSNYRANRGLVAIVHGWNNNGNTPMNPQITAAFLAVMDVNVIVVDWGHWANGAYNRAVNAVPSVGNHLGDLISFLFSTVGGNWNQVHLVGFSLGAHVVGNAGRRVGGRASRVTGLDPASMQWGGNPNALNRNSGRYVEAIHTDGRVAGIMDPIANGDFYPNGGRHPQPGCRNNVCSHGRATELFASSVRRHNRFVARGCINLAQAELSACSGAQAHMGNGVWNKNANGLFGLRTGSAYPF